MRRRLVIALAIVVIATAAIPLSGTSGARADTWNRVANGGMEPGYNTPQGQASCAIEFDGMLYAGTRNLTGCQVWRYNGTAWAELVSDGFGDMDNRAATAMAVYNGNLYVGTYRQSGRCQVWRFDGNTWTRVSDGIVEAVNNMSVRSMAVFDGKLVVGTENGVNGLTVATYDGAAWAAETANGWGNSYNTSASSMAVYGAGLYVGTHDIVEGCEVHRWSGAAWTTVVGAGAPVAAGFGDTNNEEAASMAVWNDGTEKLWVGTRNHADGAEVWTCDSLGAWALSTSLGVDNDNNRSFTTLCSYDDGVNNVLYAGTENLTDGCEVYKNFGGWSNEIGAGAGARSFGFGDPENESAISMCRFGTGLVVGTSQGMYGPDSGCQVWSLSGGNWSQIGPNGFAPNSQREATCMATFQGALYLGTDNITTGGKVWRYSGSSWSRMAIPGFSYHNGRISCMVADGTNLWVGTYNAATGGEVWCYDGSWHCRIGPPGGPGDISLGPLNPMVGSLALLDGKLWVGTMNETGCEIWRNDSPGNWTQVADNGIDDATNVTASTMCVFDGGLLVGTARNNGCSVYKYEGGWSQLVGPAAPVGPGFGSDHNRQAASSIVTGAIARFGTYNSAGCEVWSYNGSGWSKLASGGWGDGENLSAASMASVGGRLYVGSAKYPNGGEGCEVWMYCGTGWHQVNDDGFGNLANNSASSLAGLGSNLYAGTYNIETGCEAFQGLANPTIDSAAPAQVSSGDTVTLAGMNFGSSRGESFVTAGSVRANDYVQWTDDQVKFKMPPGLAGIVPITLTTGAGTSNAAAVTVTNPVWYLAEGSSDWGFDTYVTIENPNPQQVTARVTYMTPDGPVSRADVALPALSQTTVNPRDDIGAKDFSTRVECVEKKNIAVDRRMLWTGQGAASQEGHCSIGVTAPAKVWYLPEGSSKWGFECWLLVQNPNSIEATCQITYMIEGGSPKTVTETIGENSRKSFNIYDHVGEADTSIMVSSDRPVIPERAMYRNNRREGHDSIGTVAPSASCYLAEGTTAWGFTTYVLVQNPNTSDATVTLTYMTTGGPQVQTPFVLPKQSRKTLRVNDVMPGKDFSTLVASSKPVIAERAMYWDAGSGEACHDSIGMSGPHTVFYLPDGETYNGHETFTLVQNPNAMPVTVEVKYLTNGETENQLFTATIPANSRTTFNMGEKIPAGRASVVVTCKTSGRRIVVERSMYWSGRGAGTDTIGGNSD
ncbi:MAG: IPT/TIG domain-containing protein [Candidatus Geothermincolia bacterium]